MNKIVLVVVLLSALGGCAEVQHATKPQQATGKPLLAGIGDVVLRLDKERNLENVFGKSDMWGRKTKEGHTEVRYAGLEPTGEVVFARSDVQIITNETTMSRSPVTYTSGQANTTATGTAVGYGNSTTLAGTANTTYQSTTVAPTSDFHVVVPSGSIAVRLAPGETRFPIEGFIVQVIRATPSSLEYTLTRQ